MNKFTPAENVKFAEGYRSVMVEKGKAYLYERMREICLSKEVKFVISDVPLPVSGLSLVWSSEHYHLYEFVASVNTEFFVL